jgi:hypothetical protein
VAAAAEQCGQWQNDVLAGSIDLTAENAPEPHAELAAGGLAEDGKCIAAIAANVAAGSGTDLPLSDIA